MQTSLTPRYRRSASAPLYDFVLLMRFLRGLCRRPSFCDFASRTPLCLSLPSGGCLAQSHNHCIASNSRALVSHCKRQGRSTTDAHVATLFRGRPLSRALFVDSWLPARQPLLIRQVQPTPPIYSIAEEVEHATTQARPAYQAHRLLLPSSRALLSRSASVRRRQRQITITLNYSRLASR